MSHKTLLACEKCLPDTIEFEVFEFLYLPTRAAPTVASGTWQLQSKTSACLKVMLTLNTVRHQERGEFEVLPQPLTEPDSYFSDAARS